MTNRSMDLRLSGVRGAPDLELKWQLTTMTDGPEGHYLLIDRGGQPRLILSGEELARLTERGSI
jgi:hypothetical protein